MQSKIIKQALVQHRPLHALVPPKPLPQPKPRLPAYKQSLRTLKSVLPQQKPEIKQVATSTPVKLNQPIDNGNICVMTGCDSNLEWALTWWYICFRESNPDIKIVFANFGMSEKAINWCKERGEIIDVGGDFTKNWFKKPLAIYASPYKSTIWIDIDCEVRKDIRNIFQFAKNGFATTVDVHAHFIKIHKPLASGVIGVEKGNKILQEWVDLTNSSYKNYRGDQEILNTITAKYKKGTMYDKDIIIMPIVYQWLRLQGDNKGAIIMHWTGDVGKQKIKQQMANRKINSL